MRIGFACAWKRPPSKTWSGTASGIRDALGRRADVVDLGVEYSSAQTLLKYAYARRRHGRWATAYTWSRARDRMIHRRLRSSLGRTPVDAVVEIHDLARLDAPFFPYVDLSYEVYEEFYDPETGVPGLEGIDLPTIRRRRERQREILGAATGVFAMSGWLADVLAHRGGVPREKITVVYAGLNSVGGVAVRPVEAPSGEGAERRGPARLLFVGRDFYRKGGDVVVAALARLRREYSPDVRLTVAGPKKWPLPGAVPEGITFAGDLPTGEVARLFRSHDVFVMPSRFEAFGIVFLEALAHGMPVVVRSAFAMPEIVEPGKNGALVSGDDPDELAGAVAAVLEDPDIKDYALGHAGEVRERFSWDAVARRMLGAIGGNGRETKLPGVPLGQDAGRLAVPQDGPFDGVRQGR